MADKIKTGIEVTRKDNGETWYCERDRQDGTILLRDTPNKTITATLFDTTLSNITIARKFGTGLKTAPKKKTKETQTYDQQLTEFFRKVSLRMPYLCDECNQPLMAFNNFGKLCCSAHIFPKSQFKTIAMDENNIFFLGPDLLGVCDCHDCWDKLGAEHRKTMKVYQIALWAFEHFKREGLLTGHDLVKAYTYLGIEWNDTTEYLQEQDLKNIKRHGQSDNSKHA